MIQEAIAGNLGWRMLPIGARVVVRRRLLPPEAAESHHVWTDILAIVLEVRADGLLLRTDAPRQREATEVWVPASLIETAKQIPPRPHSRMVE